MQVRGATVRGGRAIESWITHCPACGHPVSVPPGSEAVACPHCQEAFPPQGLDTVHGQPAPSGGEDDLVGRALGDWHLVRLLGQGGMGRVYEAQHVGGHRRAALKVLSSDLAADPAFVKRFHREARLLADLSHPHVVEVLDRGEHEGQLWFAMEYVRGQNLRRRIGQGALAPSEAVRIAAEVAAALAYAHGRGVVHRDLKPENVLLDEQGRVHLADFGLSRLAGERGADATTLLTRTDVILGTYEYMAPEQRRGEKDLDGRADVYALGVLLYEMLTGTLPLGRFEAPSKVRPGVPEALDPIVNQALATERSRRFGSADAMRQALEDAWARRTQKTPPPLPWPAARPRPTTLLSDDDLPPLRRILRHVDVMASLDRVLGIVLLLAFVGIVGRRPMEDLFFSWIRVGSVVFLVGGILLLRQGGRLARMGHGSREGQVTASVLLLLLPPVGTAMGLYGLVVFTTETARRAFQVGRKALEGPRPVVVERTVTVVRPTPRRAAPIWLHLLLLAAILWSVHAGIVLVSTDVNDASLSEAWRTMPAERQVAVRISVVGSVVAGVASAVAFRRRRVRRGLGTAVAALALFLASAWFLSGLYAVREIAAAPPGRHRVVVRTEAARSLPPFLSLPRLEFGR